MNFESINYRPFVGKNYFNGGYRGKRILVLGESHYTEDTTSDNCHSLTEDVIEYFVYGYDGTKYLQTFLCFERGVAGKTLSQQEREEFWNSIMFYNYLQYAQPGPRQDVPSENWSKSETAFKELLTKYKPDCIICWGNRLYNNMPDWDGKHSYLEVEGDRTDIWTYTIDGKEIPMLKVAHPSTPRGKSWTYWHEFYVTFLASPYK